MALSDAQYPKHNYAESEHSLAYCTEWDQLIDVRWENTDCYATTDSYAYIPYWNDEHILEFKPFALGHLQMAA